MNLLEPGIFEARDALEHLLMPERSGGVSAFVALRVSDAPLGRENIVGIGIGQKESAGLVTPQTAIKAFVVEKSPAALIDPAAMVPPTIDGYPTDVEEVGDVIAYQLRRRFRPAPAGCSVGHKDVSAGTLGGFATLNGQLFILGNNHVLANCNDAKKGDPILQPGRADGGSNSADAFATLEAFVPLVFGGQPNDVDVALARPVGNWFENLTPFILQIGEVRGVRDAAMSMNVKKMGRTTRLTQGIVKAVSITIDIEYESGVAKMRNQVQIGGINVGSPFSQPGDSGSLILDQDNMAIAMLVGGSRAGTATFATPIATVMQHLKALPGMQDLELSQLAW